jgi:DNA-binding NtrC family response regulator
MPSHVRELVGRERTRIKAAFTPRRLSDLAREYVLMALEHFSQDRDTAARQLGITLEELNRIAES